ncbi:DUF1145 domain-containing protein [Endozoicomonas sp. Mp262]|uniref:DUF1145 domain-containing protein n=1 Tax=Endozoicomonas sp. Mp262 TaxID=2919499 RepID=UPI0021DA8DC9
MLYFGKGLTLLFWLAAIYNTLVPQTSPLGNLLNWVAPAVLVIHSIEMVFFSWRFAAVGRRLPMLDRVQIVLFGGFYLMRLFKKEQAVKQISMGDSNSAS